MNDKISIPEDYPGDGRPWIVEHNDPRFRPNVAVIVRNPHGELLMCERSDIANAWQFPQGGIDAGESILDAAKRELWEETGFTDAHTTFKEATTIWLAYLFPNGCTNAVGHIGQKQAFALFDATDDTLPAPHALPHDEFVAFQWVKPEDVCGITAPFRCVSYQKALNLLLS